MGTTISVIILIICVLLALVILAQNPKGGGLASGFTGAQQIGGVQRTADFLEKGTWTLAGTLMVLCLVSAGFVDRGNAVDLEDLSAPVEVAPELEPQQQVPEEVPTNATPIEVDPAASK